MLVQFELNNGEPIGMSIPATEHSVMTSWPTEREAILNMISHFGSGLFACVMDSYDYAKVTTAKPHLLHPVPRDYHKLHMQKAALLGQAKPLSAYISDASML